MGKRRTRLGAMTGLLIFVGLICAWAPVSAQADLSWSSAATLSPSGTSSDQMQVATDAAGDSIAVWVENDPQAGVTRIAEDTRKAGGNFTQCSTPCWVSDTAGDATSPSIALNASGQAVVTWDETLSTSGDANHFDEYVEGTVSGGFAASEYVQGLIGSIDDTDPQIGIDSAGDEFIAASIIRDQPEVSQHMVAYDKLVGDSGFYLEGIDDNPATGAPTSNNMERQVNPDASPRITVSPAGAVLITWTEEYQQLDVDAPYYETQIVEASYRAAGGNGGDANSHGGFSETPERVSVDSPLCNQAVPALDSSGNAVVAYTDNNPNGSLYPGTTVQVASRPSTATDSGSFDTASGNYETATVVSGSGLAASSPAITFDSSGDAILAWQQEADSIGSGSEAAVATRPSGGSFGSATVVGSEGLEDGPEIAVDGAGQETVEYVEDDYNSGNNGFVEAATRQGLSGAFSTPTQVTGSLNLDTADGDPQLSASVAGQAVIVWHYEDADNDTIVQASIGSAPGTVVPPPPAPPPPVPNVIVADTSLQAGQQLVLSADVSSTSALDWHFPSGPANVVGVKVGGVLQNGVRLHWFQNSLLAKVTVTSSSGVHTYSREFKLGNLPSDRYSKLVDPPISKSPRVFATGDTNTLLGKTACGAVTLYSGDQQSSGCMRPVNTVADIPDSERGVIDTLAASLNLDPTDPQLMNTAVQRLDGYVSAGADVLNNTWSVNPHGSAKLMSFPGVGALTSSNASLDVGGINFGGLSGGSGFSLHIDPGKLDIPLGNLPKPSLPDIGGFPLIGDWNVDLGSGAADITAHLQLPSWINIGGIPLQIPVSFKATPSGLVLDKVNIGPVDVNIGALSVKKFKLTYDRSSDTWTGSGEVCVLTGACLDMSPPNGEVKIVGGNLNYAGATLIFPAGTGIPLFAGVNLNQIGFGLGLDPTRIIGRAGISVLDLVQLDGELVTAFPTAAHPFVLARDEVGNDFPPEDYGQKFTEPTIGTSADVLVNLPVVGNLKLGSGYLLYEVPDYIALGGGVDVTFLKTIEIYGNIFGAANFSDHTVDFGANAGACLLFITKFCAKATVNISHAPHDGGGAGGCIDVAGFHIGGGILWAGDKIVVWPFDGCKWSRFKVDVRPSLASAAATSRTIVVKRGAPDPALELHGSGAAPLVRVTGPGGQSLDSTDSGFDHSPGGHIRILRYEGPTEDFTVVGLENAKPGRYTVSTLPGSVPFTEIDSATNPPDAKVSAHVGGSGEKRVLSYDIRNRPDQTVTFWDVDKGKASSVIGHARGGKGQIRFSPAPGSSRRTIVAEFTLDGLPAERITVAHYQPPAPTLTTPRGLLVTRTKAGIRARWHAVPGATSYELVLTDRTTGYQHLVSTRHASITVKGVPKTAGGRVTVRAVAKYRQSLTAMASFQRLTTPSNAFAKFGRCTVAKQKITCKGGPATKKPKKPTKHKKHKKADKKHKRR